MTVNFSTDLFMRGESEEILDVGLVGPRMKVFLDISITKRRLLGIVFTFSIGSARFGPDEARYYLGGPSADYTIQVKAVSGFNLLAGFEDEVMPYFDKLVDKQLTHEEAENIYFSLVDRLEAIFKSDLINIRNLSDAEVGEA